ncbi:MAG TPA: hypothetical protein VF815_16640, partial [Myxococcaceae bacterium]
NTKGRNLFIEAAKERFAHIIIFADDLFIMEEAAHPEMYDLLLSFRVCTIREFGHRLRGSLIEKWCSIGQEFTSDDAQLEQKISETEHAIDTLLGKNLLPSYPVFVLSILQSREANKNLSTASGAYGYIYEVLITAALSGASKDLTLDTQYTYISQLAYYLFRFNKRLLSHDEIQSITDEYYRRYRIRLPQESLLTSLTQALVLEETDGGYRFKYKYIYYYFVAKFFQENLSSAQYKQELRSAIADMTSKVYNEDFANILIFLVYLTKDAEIMTQMTENARQLYADRLPCDLDSDVRALSANSGPLHFLLEERNKQEAREEYRRSLDDAHPNALAELEDEQNDRQEFDEIVKINVALKTIQIMGQILRNFPGSLGGDVKLEIAKESYLLGLRTLNVMLSIFEQHRDDIKNLLKDAIRSDHPSLDEEALTKRTEQYYFQLQLGLAYGVIKKISLAVGSKHLKETFKEVLSGDDNVAIRLVDIAIKLDHFRPVPEEEVIDLYGKISQNIFSSSILKQLVVDHLYLYKTPYKTRQRLCDHLDVTLDTSKLIQSHHKK